MNRDFLVEKKLAAEAPELHRCMKNSVFLLQGMLEKVRPRFPNFTDHSTLHSLDVLEYSNRLIGAEQIEKLSAVECYVLIMACYLHDTGMSVGQKDYEEFSRRISFGTYFETHDRTDTAGVIRDFHQEFSGHYIRKYAKLLEIPSEDLVFAVVQASRGHRKTDLFDALEYPDMHTEYGVIRLAFLAAVIRLADEIDVAADRNSELLFDPSRLTRQWDIDIFGIHESILSVTVETERIVLHAKPKSERYISMVENLNDKIQQTLDYCREAAEKRSELRLTQTKSEVLWL